MSRNFETQDCQWHEVKRIKFAFAEKGVLWNKACVTFLFSQVVLISSIQPISSNSFNPILHRERDKNAFLVFMINPFKKNELYLGQVPL